MSSEHDPRTDVVRRLIDEFAARADEPGRPPVKVLRGPAGIGKSHIARIVGDRLEASGVPVRRAAGGEAQQRLAFGALLHLLPPAASPVAVEFELVQRLRSALVAQDDISVLVVDDIGLLDERSAGLVESVMLQGDIAVLATERTSLTGVPVEHALSSALRSIADIVDVPPMSDDELGELLTEWNGPGEIGSIRRMSEMARGNPLVLRVLLNAAHAAGSIGERDGVWYLGEFRLTDYSLERLVAEHLDRLDESEWALLRCLAVAGSLPRDLAARIDLESLERLERDVLVYDDPVVIGHPLYAEVIVDTLSPEQIRRVCSKLVASIGPDDDVDAARLGSWLLRADHGIDDEVARRGVSLALARWENDLARQLIEAIAEPTVADRVQLIWAHANVGRLADAAEVADAVCRDAQDDDDRVMAETARAELWALQMGRRSEAFEALALLRSALSGPAQIAKVDAATALYARLTGNRERAETAAAVLDAGAVADPGVRLAVVIGGTFLEVFAGQFGAADTLIAEGLILAERLGERHNWVRLRIAEAMCAMFTGDLETSRAIVAESLRLADLAGVRPAHVVWLGLDAQLAQLVGDFDLAERRAREAVRAGDHVDDFGAAGFVRGDLAALLVEVGAAAELGVGSSPIGLARARIRLAAPDEVDGLAAELAGHTADAGYGLWAPWIAREAVRRGAAPKCARLLTRWAQEQDGPVVAAFAAHAVGQAERDADRVASSARALDALGFVMPSLDAHVAAAELRLDLDGACSAIRRDLLRIRSLAGRVRPSLPPSLADRVAAAGAEAEMPSDRQLEIADLAASGLASKEIADQLIVSVRTVDNHLAAVYRKLAVNSREELADLLGDD